MPDDPTILLTRPEAAARRFGASLAAAGCRLDQMIAPILDIRPIEGALAATRLSPEAAAGGVILSSVHGVRALAAETALRPPAWCVGQATAQAARDEGFEVMAAARDADDLFRVILGAGQPGPFLHARGRHSRGALPERLRAAGLPTDEVVIYDQTARPLDPAARALLTGRAPVILPLFSPRSARLLAEAGPFTAPLHLVAISDAAAQSWAEAVGGISPQTLHVAHRPDGDAMIAATLSAARAATGA